MHVCVVAPDPAVSAALGPILFQDPRWSAISICPDANCGWLTFKRQRPGVFFVGIGADRAQARSGLSLADRIRRSDDRCVIIFLSAQTTMPPEIFKAYPLDCLGLPLDQARLRLTVDRLFANASRQVQDKGQLPVARVRIRYFGEFACVTDGGRTADLRLPGGKCRELLAFLLSRPDRSVSRDQLLEHLFGGKKDERTINRLHVTISGLRKALRRVDGLSLQGQYSLSVAEGVCDLTDYLRHARSIMTIDEGNVRLAERIAGLYAGTCFGEADYEWAEPLKASLDEAQELLLLRIAAFHESKNDLKRSEQALMTLVELNPWSEGGQTALLDLYINQRRPAQYKKAYEAFRQIMEDELDLPMDVRFQKAYQTFLPS